MAYFFAGCPVPVSVNSTLHQCGAPVTFGSVNTSDNCAVVSSGLASNGAFGNNTVFGVGLRTVMYYARDAAGNNASCSFDVHVFDVEAPVVNCSGNITVATDAGVCAANVSFVASSVTDNCDSLVARRVTGFDSGSAFPLGSTVETYEATDYANNSGSCSFTVVVSDREPPRITCPAPIVQGTQAGQCGATVTYATVVGSDNCGSVTVSAGSGSLQSGAYFAVGQSLVNWTAVDSIGLQSWCAFQVHVRDYEAPSVVCPSNIDVSAPLDSCGAQIVFGGLAVTDNCGVAQVVLNSSGMYSNGSVFGVSRRTVSYLVSDASGNSATCGFNVTVRDIQAPQISCPASAGFPTLSGQCGAVVSYTAPTVSDNCAGVVTERLAGPASGNTVSPGMHSVWYSAVDLAGLGANCTFNLSVQDNEAPRITCPNNMTVSTGLGICTQNVSYSLPTATDNCALSSVVLMEGGGIGAVFALGSTTVRYRAEDNSGNTADCSFVVTVVDQQSPALVGCPTNVAYDNTVGQCGRSVSYTAPSVVDNCAGSVVSVSGPASGAFFGVGTTQVSFLAKDGSNNTASCAFNITVRDAELPIVVCPGNISQNTLSGTCTSVVSYNTPVFSDNCAGTQLVRRTGLASGSAFGVGTTVVGYSVNDTSGNSATCEFYVSVADIWPPVLSNCPSNQLQSTGNGVCSRNLTFTLPTVSDNCGANLSLGSLLGSGSSFPQSEETLVSYVAKDAAGLVAYCNFTVTVLDLATPQITCPATIYAGSDSGLCGARVNFSEPVGVDNCPNATTARGPGSLAPLSLFPVGLTVETYTATDGHPDALSRQCSFTVSVADVEPPKVTCPASTVQSAATGQCSASVAHGTASYSDNCAGVTVSGPASPSTYGLGTTVVNYTAQDAANLVTWCYFNVTVVDLERPRLTCSDVGPVVASSGCGTAVSYAMPAVADNCGAGGVSLSVIGFASGSVFGVGNSTVTVVGTDGSGNSANCTMTVSVIDGSGPSIECPANISANSSFIGCYSNVSFSTPVGVQGCSQPWTQRVSGQASGTLFNVGSTVETFVVTDLFGRTASCSFSIEVIDTYAPQMTCPADILVPASAGVCGRTIHYSGASVTDNCMAGVVVQQSGGFTNGSFAAVGSSLITYTARDGLGSGLSSQCSFNVRVVDSEVPVIMCPANIRVSTQAGVCNATVSYTVSSSDNCGFVNQTLLQGLSSGSTFPQGATTVTYGVVDGAGNQANCSFVVTVVDQQVPDVTCPGNMASPTSPDGFCGLQITYASAQATDNCGTVNVKMFAGNASGSVFNVGTSTVGYNASDSQGNWQVCTFTVTVTDSETPKITCPSNRNVGTDLNACNATVVVPNATSSDNCPGVATTLSGLPGGSVFQLGATQLVYTATAMGVFTPCGFTVTVVDTQAPNISCPSSIAQVNDAGLCSAMVTYEAVQYSDNCGSTLTQASGLASGSVFAVGLSNNTFRATDGVSTSSCWFSVRVTDSEKPTLSCPENISVSNNAGICGAVVTHALPNIQDNCGVSATSRSGGVNGSVFSVGSSAIVYNASDAAGNSGSCAFWVEVRDTEAPKLTCPSNVSINTDGGVCTAVVNYGNVNGSDNCGGASPVLSFGLAAGQAFSLGSTLVGYTIVDGVGLSASCAFGVAVSDSELPRLTCPSNVVVAADAGQCSAVGVYGSASAWDNCGDVTVSRTSGPANGTRLSVGVWVVVLQATDGSQNTVSCNFTVTVQDLQPPVLSCPSNTSVETDSGKCTAAVTLANVSFSDNCANSSLHQLSGPSISTSVFGVGQEAFHFSVQDGSGNSAQCLFTVQVKDVTPPVLVCPGNVTVMRTDIPQCAAMVNFTTPVGTDNCNSSTVRLLGLGSGSAFAVGNTMETYQTTDDSGNSVQCSFVVTVVDRASPMITCPTVQSSYTSEYGVCGAHVVYSAPVTADNCNVSSSGSAGAVGSGNLFTVGNHTEKYYVEDTFGNNASCSFDVVVVDVQSPSIVCPASGPVPTEAGLCSAAVTYETPVVADNCPAAQTVQLTGPVSGTRLGLGNYSIGYSGVDASGLAANCTFVRSVVDTETPVITCPASITVSSEAGLCSAAVVFGSVTASDNCGSAIISLVSGGASANGSRFGVGTTLVQYRATDGSGLKSDCSFNVTVVDNEVPLLTCSGSSYVNSSVGECGATVTYGVSYSDNCNVTKVNRTRGLSSGAFFPVGLTAVEHYVKDAAGNSVSCMFTVNVSDVELPQLSCSGNITRNADVSVCTTTVTYNSPVWSDNCPSASLMQVSGPGNVSVRTVGVTPVSYVAVDAAGNSRSCAFSITVVDNQPPILGLFLFKIHKYYFYQ